jgi:predicted DCC family thiol-disulfide oxidoreductase YuxK
VSSAAAGDVHEAERHLLLFDGVCALCDGVVQFVLARDRRRFFDFAPIQSPAARAILERFRFDPDALDTFYVVVNYRGPAPVPLARARAALFLLRQLGWPWKAAAALRVLPSPLLDTVYNLIARHRYRVFGQYEQCVIPRPEDRYRFLDS